MRTRRKLIKPGTTIIFEYLGEIRDIAPQYGSVLNFLTQWLAEGHYFNVLSTKWREVKRNQTEVIFHVSDSKTGKWIANIGVRVPGAIPL